MKTVNEKAGGMMAGGARLRAADLHVHTSCSADVLPAPSLSPSALYEKACSENLDFITFTDHDTMDAYDIVGWQRERLVPGVELTVRDRERVGHTIHVNVYLLDRRQFGELREIAGREANLEHLLAYLAENNLPFVYNHPFGFSVGDRPSYRKVAELVRLFPVVEHNMHRVRGKNRLARELARKNGRGMVSTTDTHTGSIGAAFTLAPGETFRDYFGSIARGESRLVSGDLSIRILKEEMSAWLEMFFGLEQMKPGQVCNSGTRIIDYFVRVFGNDLFREYPGCLSFSRRVCDLLTRTGAPAAFYLRAQDLLAFRIGRLPGLMEPAEPVA